MAGVELHVATATSATAEAAPAAAMLDLLTVGEPLICLTSAGRLPSSPTLAKSIGGAEANVAIGLARLRLRAAYVSRVGADPFGDEVVRTLRGEGVDVSRVERSQTRPTGLMVKELRSPDDVRVHYYRQGSAASELDGIGGGLPPARHVHATGITLALGPGPARAVRELLSAGRAMGASVSFDPNIRLKLWSLDDAVAAIREVLPDVDDLLLSEAEALAIAATGDLDEALDRSPIAGSRGSSCGAAPRARSGSRAASASRSRRRPRDPSSTASAPATRSPPGTCSSASPTRRSPRRSPRARGRRDTPSRRSATTRACPTAPTTTPGAAAARRSTDEPTAARELPRRRAPRRNGGRPMSLRRPASFLDAGRRAGTAVDR
jgi:sugar/nucleoside kinase (ribokinase family)